MTYTQNSYTQYKIDFVLVRLKKNFFFYQNIKQYKDAVYINLLDDDKKFIELTDETIKGFISICQNEIHSIIWPANMISQIFEILQMNILTIIQTSFFLIHFYL